MMLLAAALAAATPTVTDAPKPVVVEVKTDPAAAKKDVDPFAAMATFMKMFDKFFPPQPEPDPARLAAARTTAQALLPAGAYGRGMGQFMGGFADRIIEMKPSDLGDLDFASGKPKAKVDPAKDITLHQKMAAEDPYFDERMRLTKGAIQVELDKLSTVIEPKLREGIARTVARRFNDRQIADINAFFATDSGKALGTHFLGMWFDPDMMRSMMGTMPEMVIAMPSAIARIGAATAHLPKPPKKKAESPAKGK
jgi:hypothetical protein